MSTPLAPEYAPTQPQTPAPKKKFNWKLAGMIFAAVLIGGVIGSVSNPAPPPVIQVEKEIVEKEVTVVQTPASCLMALEHAEAYMQSSGRVVNVFVQILDAVQVLDAAKITSLNPKIEAETAVIKELSPKYLAASADCRADR